MIPNSPTVLNPIFLTMACLMLASKIVLGIEVQQFSRDHSILSVEFDAPAMNGVDFSDMMASLAELARAENPSAWYPSPRIAIGASLLSDGIIITLPARRTSLRAELISLGNTLNFTYEVIDGVIVCYRDDPHEERTAILSLTKPELGAVLEESEGKTVKEWLEAQGATFREGDAITLVESEGKIIVRADKVEIEYIVSVVRVKGRNFVNDPIESGDD